MLTHENVQHLFSTDEYTSRMGVTGHKEYFTGKIMLQKVTQQYVYQGYAITTHHTLLVTQKKVSAKHQGIMYETEKKKSL